MTIIVFLVDTTASMMQKTYLGTTYLDFARLTVEQFLKLRQRDPNYKGDRYMLMTFDDYPLNVKSGWKESQAIFTEQLKNLRPGGLCSFESSVESVLRFVNLNRMQSGIENYGFGRYPCYSEHVVVIAVTDGSSSEAGCSNSPDVLSFSKPATIGAELTVEPFRWDQRLFTLVLRFPGQPTSFNGAAEEWDSSATVSTPTVNAAKNAGANLPTTSSAANASANTNVPNDSGRIDAFCTAMGGRSFCIKSHRMMTASIETIIQRIQNNGVMVKLQKFGSDPPPLTPSLSAPQVASADRANSELGSNQTAADGAGPAIDVAEALGDTWKTQSVMLILKQNKQGQGNWPIPEAYFGDTLATTLPPRLAHPVILFRCEASQPMIKEDFPFDKYELSNTPLSQYILSRKDATACWQVFVENSSRIGGIGMPFGYLKTSSNMQSVILFLMPYNYPALLPLLDEAKIPGAASTSAFRQKMDKYLTTVPPYYYSPLKKAFKRINLVVPFLEEYNQQIYNYSVVSLMTKMKHLGKEEFDTACANVAKNLEALAPALLNGPQFVKATHCRTTNPDKNALLERDLGPSVQPYLAAIPPIFKDVKICVSDSNNGVSSKPLVIPSAQFKNPFDIDRRSLIGQLDKMRINFDQQVETNALHVLEGGMPGQKIKLQHAEDLHSQPISKMGDYQEYMRRMSSIGAAPLRELEPQAARPHAFGNPFKLDKKNIAVDEVGEMNTTLSATTAAGNGDRGERRAARGQSAPPTMSAGGMAGSLSSVPVAIRSKRKPGAIDPSLLSSWKRRRRFSSFASDASDVSSLASDASNVTELDEILSQKTIGDEGDDDIDMRNDFHSDDDDMGGLVIYENGDDFDEAMPSSPTSSISSLLSNSSSTSNGYRSEKSSGKKDSQKVEPDLEQKSSSSRTSTAVKTNGLARNGLPITIMSASEMSNKQKELSRVVRGIGDRHTVLSRCLKTLNEVRNTHERVFLIRFASKEARRFKRSDLTKQLDKHLRLVMADVTST